MRDKYLVPMAGKTVLGAVKIGAGLSIEKDGTLNVADVSDAISLVREGKQMIADAVTEKGVATEPGASFKEMANNIVNIPSKCMQLVPRTISGNIDKEYGITITASNSYVGREPYYAFTQCCNYGVVGGFWSSGTLDDAWLQVEFDQEVTVSNYRLSTYATINTNLQFYDEDEGAWKYCNDIFTVTANADYTPYIEDVDLPTPVQAKKFRFAFYNNPTSNVYSIGNCQLYGTKNVTTDAVVATDKPEMEWETAGELITTIIGRAYYKTTSDFAIGGYAESHDGWYAPLLISQTAAGVIYEAGNTSASALEFEYEGETWYYSNWHYAWRHIDSIGDGRGLYLTDIEGVQTRLNELDSFDSDEDIARAVLDYYFND